MDEASVELRNAVFHALSVNTDHSGTATGGNNELLHDDVQARHSSSDGSYISSLSGSLPSERSSALAAASRRRRNARASNCGATAQREENGENSRSRWRWRLEAATRVEGAVSSYELAAFNHHGEAATSRVIIPGEDRDFATSGDDGDIDLLVAVLTAVPRNLLRQQADLTVNQVQNSQQEEEYLASMEQTCFNAACIASDVIRKYFQMATSINIIGNRQTLEVRHIHELIDEVVQISNTDPSVGAWFNLDPIIEVLNSLSESRNVQRSINERGGNDGSIEDVHQSLFSSLTSKECLRLVHTLIYRYLCEREDGSVQPTSQVGYFISYLLEHFSAAIAEDTGYNSFENGTVSLFDAWADGVDEHMVHRLNDEEARDIYDLIVRYHIGSLQTSLQQIKRTDSLISNVIAGFDSDDGIDETTLESVIITIQDTIRHMTIAVATTEAMEKLGLEHDREIPVVFHPLIISYARFTASLLQDTMNLLRTTCGSAQDGEEMSMLADDLLFRLCRVNIGFNFLKTTTDTGDEEEVLAVSLIRAASTQCICGNARFLLDIAASRSQSANKGVTCNDPPSKRSRVNISNFENGQLQPKHLCRAVGSSLEERREAMADILLACLALSQFNQVDEDPDFPAANHASWASFHLISAMLPPGDLDEQALIDYLNPWHSLRVKPTLRLANVDYPSLRDEEGDPTEALLSYALLTPHLLETKKPVPSP